MRSEYLSSHKSRFNLPDVAMGLVLLDTRRSMEMGWAFDFLPADHRHDTATFRSFSQCGIEILAQFEFLKGAGFRFEFSRDPALQYPTSLAMMADVAENFRLRVFTGGEHHPMFGIATTDDAGITLNHKFRAVHDLFGHAVEGHQFGPCGEENAFAQHSTMFSDSALPALTADLRGQNSWLNFGPQMFDESGWKGDPRHPRHVQLIQREYAQQKVALLPRQYSSRDSFSPIS